MTFRKDEQEDDRWRLREEILLAEVERDNLTKLHDMLHTAESAAAQYVEQQIFDHHYKAAQKQYQAVSLLLLPYKTDEKPIDQQVIENLDELWRAEFGDPDGPDVQAAIEDLKRQD